MENNNAWEKVLLARDANRLTAASYINILFPDFIELHGDRYFADDAAIIGGLATLDGMPVTVIAQEKGTTTEEKIKRNFGMAHPEGYRKALRLMKQAEKFKRPVICFVDTQGAYPGIGAEERGQAEAIARNLMELSNLKTPVISVIIGEGGSGGALALAVADKIYMLENAIYSVLSPEGFATILWKDVTRAAEAADVMKISAPEIYERNLIDGVFAEPTGGMQANEASQAAIAAIGAQILADIKTLQEKPLDELLTTRYDKYRNITA